MSRLVVLLSVALLAGPAGARGQGSPDAARVRTWLDAHVPEMMRGSPASASRS
jgi:hypothetical protein